MEVLIMLGNKEAMARNLQRMLDRKGISRNKICDDLGIAYSTFSNWMQGNSYPRIDKIEMMANYFGCMKSDLVEEQHDALVLSSQERRLIEYYRLLTEADRIRIEERMKIMLEK